MSLKSIYPLRALKILSILGKAKYSEIYATYRFLFKDQKCTDRTIYVNLLKSLGDLHDNGLVSLKGRFGYYRITPRGFNVLKDKEDFDNSILERIELLRLRRLENE